MKRWLMKWILVCLATIVIYEICHDMATAERGYEAIGGEIFAFAIPIAVWAKSKWEEGASK